MLDPQQWGEVGGWGISDSLNETGILASFMNIYEPK